MKKLLYIALMMVLAGTLSCHRTSDVELRLIAIDSIIADAPDSALSLLEAIDSSGESPGTKGLTPASRMTQSEHAYHALLTAQALYKAYIPATSDSLINLAWDYYKDHGPYDRRIRAMLYKGTTAEELGQPDSAMRWYKRTELESRPDDHYHRGFSEMAMGTIFNDKYVQHWAISYYRKAVNDLKNIDNYVLTFYCINNLGAIYRKDNPDSAIIFINEAIDFAKKHDMNNEYYDALSYLAGYYNLKKRYRDALFTASKVIENTINSYSFSEATYAACEAACGLSMPDTAKLFFSNLPQPVTTRDSFMHEYTLSIIAMAEGDSAQAQSYKDTYEELSDKLLYNKYRDILLEQTHIAEKEYSQSISKQKTRLFLILLPFIIFIIAIAIIRIWNSDKKRKKAEMRVTELDDSKKEIIKLLEQVQYEKNDIAERLSRIKEDEYSSKIKSFELQTTLISLLLKTHGNSQENDFLISENIVWKQMREFADASTSEIITKLETRYPSLSDNDKKLLILYICGCSAETSALALGYSNTKSVKNRLRIMPKEVMNLKLTVKELVEKFRMGEHML